MSETIGADRAPADVELRSAGPCVYEIARRAGTGMRVRARVFADEDLLGQIRRDRSIAQLVNVTTLPGIVDAALGRPDMHEGYGLPVGGVAATRLPDGVISPGGIGFDINCGVRCPGNQELAEEAPLAYKDVNRVVEVVHRAGIARKVARLRPIGVVKG